MPYAFNDDKSKWTFNGLCYFPGDTINLSTNFYRGAGSLTNNSKTIGFTIPTKPIVNAQISVFNLSINVRHPDGYYPYYVYGGSRYALGPTLVEVARPSQTTPPTQVYLRAIETINAYVVDGGIRFDVVFNESLVNSGGSIVRNNVPVGIDASATIYLA